ncbi:MAG TPA: hypothetical protein VNJ46_04610 [Gaiellaceae bacterium]|nr:hypothetical protein [Gaiellaceae bacterium]
MYARVTSVEGSPERVEQGISSFRESVLPLIREAGGRGALLLIDRETGKGMAITLWPDEQTMRASEERANELRRQVVQEMGAGGEPRVDRYEVAVFDV